MSVTEAFSYGQIDEGSTEVVQHDGITYETHPSIYQKSLELADKIERHYHDLGVKISKIAVPARGGWYIASELSEWLGIDNDQLIPFAIQSYKGMEHAEPGWLSISREMPGLREIEGEHILTVDDVWDTGHTLNFLGRYLKIHRAASNTIATLHFKPKKNQIDASLPNKPDVYVAENNDWIDYPWERARRLRGLMGDIVTRKNAKVVILPDQYLGELAESLAG